MKIDLLQQRRSFYERFPKYSSYHFTNSHAQQGITVARHVKRVAHETSEMQNFVLQFLILKSVLLISKG